MNKRLAGMGLGLALTWSAILSGCGGGDDGGGTTTAGSSGKGGTSSNSTGGTAGKGGSSSTAGKGGTEAAAGKGGTEAAAGKGGSGGTPSQGGSGGTASGTNGSGGSNGGSGGRGDDGGSGESGESGGSSGSGGREPCTPASTDTVAYSGTCNFADHCSDQYDVTFTPAQLQQFCEQQAGTWSTTRCSPAGWASRCTQELFGGIYVHYLPPNSPCVAGCNEPL